MSSKSVTALVLTLALNTLGVAVLGFSEFGAAHAESALFGPASGTATIDGVVDVTEWSSAATETIAMSSPNSGTFTASLYVMNDGAYLYLGFVIDDDEFTTDPVTFLPAGDALRIDFDQDHDGVLFEAGDDALGATAGSPVFHDRFVSGTPAASSLEADTSAGGTQDGAAAASRVGSLNHFEIRHPLCSGDPRDFCLQAGEVVGFRVEYLDAGTTVLPEYPGFGFSVLYPTDGVADIVIAEPEGAVVFVSATLGSDSNDGSMARPVQTLTWAIQLASSRTPRSDITVHEGDYHSGSTLTLQDDMSLLGGFEAYTAADGTVQGWTQTGGPTRIFGPSPVLEVLDITSPTAIGGVTVIAESGSPGGRTTSIASGDPDFLLIHKRGMLDVNEVWLHSGSIPASLQTRLSLLTPNLTPDLGVCGTQIPMNGFSVGQPDTYNHGVWAEVPPLHEPADEPNVEPYYRFGYVQAMLCEGDGEMVPFIPENCVGHCHPNLDGQVVQFTPPFTPRVHYVEGYEIVRETYFLFDRHWALELWRFEQVLRGPDQNLYLYRPAPGLSCNPEDYHYTWMPQLFYHGDMYGWRYEYPGPTDFTLWDVCRGPILMEDYLRNIAAPDIRVYNLFEVGDPGAESIAVRISNANDNLVITNNVILAGSGGEGGDGSDWGDGGTSGDGGDGGDSIGILLEDSTPIVLENVIETGGGGDGGSGNAGGDGGDSCGIFLSGVSSIPPGYREGNTFGIGPAGRGGNPDGENGYQSEICPPPGIQINTLPPVIVTPLGTSILHAFVPQFSTGASFSAGWLGSDVVMTLSTPSGTPIGRDVLDLNVSHVVGANFEAYTVTRPEPGEWTIQLFGAEVPETGEEVTVTVTAFALNRPPIAVAGPSRTIEANGRYGAYVTLDGSGSSDPDGDQLTYSWSGSFGTVQGARPTLFLRLGCHEISLVVTDGTTSTTPDTTSVCVLDTTPPALTVLSPQAGLGLQDELTFVIRAEDPVSDILSVTVSIRNAVGNPVGFEQLPAEFRGRWTLRFDTQQLPDGFYDVVVEATDSSGNVGSTTVVMVQDTTPPALTLPPEVVAEAGPFGAVVEFSVEAEDNVDGTIIPLCTQPSGGTFPLGETTVECTATDAAGNTATGTFVVSVHDTIPPEAIVVGAIDGDGSPVASGGSTLSDSITLTFTAIDGTGVVNYICSLDREAFSPCLVSSTFTVDLGLHTLIVNAIDFGGNVDPTPPAFSWTRLTPAQATEEAIGELQDVVDSNPGTPLADKVEDAISQLETAVTELEKSPPDNQAAMGSIEGAVGDLISAVDSGDLSVGEGVDMMDQLVAIARQLALDGLEAAESCAPEHPDLAVAQASFGKGEALRASGLAGAYKDMKDAVNKYKDALAQAEGVLAVCDSSGDLAAAFIPGFLALWGHASPVWWLNTATPVVLIFAIIATLLRLRSSGPVARARPRTDAVVIGLGDSSDVHHAELHGRMQRLVRDIARATRSLRDLEFPMDRFSDRTRHAHRLIASHRCREASLALEDLRAVLVGYATLIEDGWDLRM